MASFITKMNMKKIIAFLITMLISASVFAQTYGNHTTARFTQHNGYLYANASGNITSSVDTIMTDTIRSRTNNGDLFLYGRGTGLVNIEGAYTLPGVDGTSGYLISTNGAGVWGYTDPSSLQVTFGTDNQVPFVNAGGTDFDYSANLTFDGTTGTINNIQIAGSIITNNNAGSSTILSGGGANDGASVIFYDDTHATLANDITFRNNTSASAQYDHSASLWDFQNKAITTTGIGTFGSLSLTTDLSVANGGTGASSFTDGGILYGNGASAFSVTSAPAGSDEFLVSTGAGTWGLESASSARTSLGLGTMAIQNATSVNIDGGTIDGTPIAGSTGSFTTLNASGNTGIGGSAPSSYLTGTLEGLSINPASGQNPVLLLESTGSATPIHYFWGNNTNIQPIIRYGNGGNNATLRFQRVDGTTIGSSVVEVGSINSSGAWSTNGNSLSAGATTTTTMRNSSNAGTGDDISYYDSDGDLTRSTIDISDIVTETSATPFTPVIADASTGGNTGTFTGGSGYTKIGSLVILNIQMIDISTAGMTGGNDIYIRNLPFTSANLIFGVVAASVLTFSGNITYEVSGGTTYGRIRETISASFQDYVTVSEISTGVTDLNITLVYLE